jgi:Flp pilus assembly protein TadG
MGERRQAGGPRGCAAFWRQLQRLLESAMSPDRGSTGDGRQRAGRRGRKEDGQAIVELAISLPLLLLLVTGIMQFGLMFNKAITLNDAVRSGARALSLAQGLGDPCDYAINQTVASAVNMNLSASQVTATLNSPDTCGSGSYPSRTGGSETQGDQATVSATYPYTLTVFGLPLFNVNLNASASDAIE